MSWLRHVERDRGKLKKKKKTIRSLIALYLI